MPWWNLNKFSSNSISLFYPHMTKSVCVCAHFIAILWNGLVRKTMASNLSRKVHDWSIRAIWLSVHMSRTGGATWHWRYNPMKMWCWRDMYEDDSQLLGYYWGMEHIDMVWKHNQLIIIYLETYVNSSLSWSLIRFD